MNDTITLSPQQEDVLEFVRVGTGNAVLEAVAGSGKTSTLIEICDAIPPSNSVVFTAFNKKIAQEIKHRLGSDHSNVHAATFHSIGLSTWKRHEWRSEVDGDIIYKLMDAIATPPQFSSFVSRAVSIAKQSCFGIKCNIDDYQSWRTMVDHHNMEEMLLGEDEISDINLASRLDEAIHWAIKLIKSSIDQHDQFIDFDDMLFAPLYHHARFYKHDWVLVDEAQDTNPARRMIASELLGEDGRIIAVGDRHQAIYGFTGASADALDLISDVFNCRQLPLTVSWRCATSIVKEAQNYVSHIEAAPGAPAGIVRTIDETEFNKLTLEPTDVILCRNTRPIVLLALRYLAKSIPACVEGRDIGRSLTKLVRKWKKVKKIKHLRIALEKHLGREVKRLSKKSNTGGQIHSLQDKIDSLNAIMETMYDYDHVNKLTQKINSLFQDTEGRHKQVLTLSTIHKAKGREWNRVYIYGRNLYMPSKYAKQEWELEQENNLIYVAVTRAKMELIDVRLDY
jgi:DNA helicase-2/ATP-dependent DNA helicase PcrA